MPCKRFKNRFLRFVIDGDKSLHSEFHHHIEACPKCRADYNMDREMEGLLCRTFDRHKQQLSQSSPFQSVQFHLNLLSALQNCKAESGYTEEIVVEETIVRKTDRELVAAFSRAGMNFAGETSPGKGLWSGIAAWHKEAWQSLWKGLDTSGWLKPAMVMSTLCLTVGATVVASEEWSVSDMLTDNTPQESALSSLLARPQSASTSATSDNTPEDQHLAKESEAQSQVAPQANESNGILLAGATEVQSEASQEQLYHTGDIFNGEDPASANSTAGTAIASIDEAADIIAGVSPQPDETVLASAETVEAAEEETDELSDSGDPELLDYSELSGGYMAVGFTTDSNLQNQVYFMPIGSQGTSVGNMNTGKINMGLTVNSQSPAAITSGP